MSDYALKISATNYAGATTFTDFYDLHYKKELNKLSECRVTIYNPSIAQKALIKEGNILYLLYGTSLVLKGEIRNVDKDESNDTYTIDGNGMEIKLHDQGVRGRTQWDDTAADDIIKSLISGVMAEGTIEAALKVGFRAEEDSILKSVISLARDIGWDWYVDQDATFDTDRLNFVAHRGSSTSIAESFSATTDALDISRKKDVDSVYNVIRVFGYGDGINQIMSESFAATSNRATLSAEITAPATSLTVNEDISSFPTSGDLRCGREWIKYTSKNNETKTFSGLTRGHIPGTNPPSDNPYYIDAYAHKKGAEIIDLQYSNGGFPTKATAESGSSINIYGLKENTYPDQSIVHQSTVDLLAQRLVSKYETPIARAEFVAMKEILTADIGDLVRIGFIDMLYPSADLYPSAGLYPDHASATYRLIAYEFDEAEYTMRLTLGNAADDFLRDISELQKNLDISSIYGLGNTIPIYIQSYENCDPTHPLHLRFFLPPELKAINHVYLNFKIRQYRAYTGTTPSGGGSTTPAGGGHTTPAGGGHTSGVTPESHLINCEIPTAIGTFLKTVSLNTHTHSGPSHMHSGPSHNHSIPFVDATPDYNVGLVGGQHGLRTDGAGSGDFASTNLGGTGNTGYGGTGDTGEADGGTVELYPVEAYESHALPDDTHTHAINNHTHTVSDHQHSTPDHQHTMKYEIYEATETSPSITVKVGEDGGSLTEISGSPFTTDQTKLDITDLVRAVGVDKWIDVEFKPNQIRRIEANLYGQGFIESK